MVRGFEVVKRIENKKEVKLPERATANKIEVQILKRKNLLYQIVLE